MTDSPPHRPPRLSTIAGSLGARGDTRRMRLLSPGAMRRPGSVTPAPTLLDRAAEGFDKPVAKGYVYLAMAFSVFVEVLDIRARRHNEPPVQLHQPDTSDAS